MNRRSFLKLLGVSAAAAVVTPTTVLASGSPRSEILVTEYVLSARQLSVGMIDGFVLPAPAGKLCRARITLPAGVPYDAAVVRGLASFNDWGEAVLERVGGPGEPSMLMGPTDPHVFARDFAPVDWGILSRKRAIEVDYRERRDADTELFLGLFYETHATTACPPGAGEEGQGPR